jgi:cytoskeletal protein RodZ
MYTLCIQKEKPVLHWALKLYGVPAAAENCYLKGCILEGEKKKEKKKKKKKKKGKKEPKVEISCLFVMMLAILLISSAVLTLTTSFCFHVSMHSNHNPSHVSSADDDDKNSSLKVNCLM